MKISLVSILASIGFSFASLIATAQGKGAEFAGKYLFTHSYDSKAKEFNHVISKCFKLNSAAKKVLQTYDSCQTTPNGLAAPLNKAAGQCTRSDKSSAYFFDSATDCEAARADSIDGANS